MLKEDYEKIKIAINRICIDNKKLICFRCKKEMELDKLKDWKFIDLLTCFPLKSFTNERFVISCKDEN